MLNEIQQFFYLNYFNIWAIITNSLYFLILISLIKTIKNKKFGVFATAFLINSFFIYLFKNAFKILRPFPFDNPSFGYSFFSGHSSFAFLAFYFLIDNPLFFIWALSIALSRLALKMHYFIDVLFGSFFGFFIAYYVDKNYNKWKKNLEKNKNEVLRKLIHIVFYLSFIFLFLWNEVYFKVYLVLCLIFLIFLSNINEKGELNKIEHPLIKPLVKAKRKEEENKKLFHLIFPTFWILSLYFLGFKKIMLFIILTIAIGDGLTGLLVPFLENYSLSQLISALILFLITSMYFTKYLGIVLSITFLFSDYLSKKLKINDNYLIPVISTLVFLFV